MRLSRFVFPLVFLVVCLSCCFAFGQNRDIQLVLAVEPTETVGVDQPLKVALTLKNTAHKDLLVSPVIDLGIKNPYGDFTLQWKPTGATEFNDTMKVIIDTFGAKRIVADELLRTGTITILKPDHFIGVERVGSFKEFFALPPGSYDIRAHYSSKSQLERDGVKFPQGEFYSNVIALEVRPQ